MLKRESARFLESLRRFKNLDPLKELLPISQRDFMVLMIVQEYCDKKEAVRPGQLAQCLDLSLPAASDMLKRQCDKGLIIKKTDPLDRRSYIVELSELGKQIYAEGQEILTRFLETIFERYGKENMDRLLLVMDDVYQLMAVTKKEMLEEKDA